jgi:cob(I)alamin adenosyltransferase
MKQGLLQVYTGDGKGKTTAALGLAVRAAGAGLKVLVVAFIKGRPCSEWAALGRFSDLIAVRPCGRGRFIRGTPAPEDVAAAREGLAAAARDLASGEWDVVILDEANGAVAAGLFAVDDLLAAVGARARGTEAVVTGRGAHARLIEAADLVTEMREVRHYFRRGVRARRGIED